MSPPEAPSPRREVFCGDALAWLADNAPPDGASVITSLPDISELRLGPAAWKTWFIDAARAVIRWVPREGVAIFYQSDVRHQGVWLDKSYLVLRAAEAEGASLLWRCVVCRKPAGTLSQGRASYSHMLVLSTSPRAPRRARADVLPDAGFMPWSRAMGAAACRVACDYVRDETEGRLIVDPFCGKGTVLAVANALGLGAIGVDLSPSRCRAAKRLTAQAPPV